MTKLSILAGAALIAVSGAALAQPGPGPRAERQADITRQQAAERADQRFARLDLNNDGRVTVEEARQAHERMRAERRQRMEQRLAQLTPEQRAQVEERRARWQERRGERAGQRGERRGGEHRAMRGQRLFGEQGYITREQMRERALARFDRMDANGDGVLTAEERRQAREQMRERMRERRGRAG